MIRPALDADAVAIAEIEARTWRWAYEDFVPAEAMPIATERVPLWREHIAAAGVRVFDQDGTVVGYAAVREVGGRCSAFLRIPDSWCPTPCSRAAIG